MAFQDFREKYLAYNWRGQQYRLGNWNGTPNWQAHEHEYKNYPLREGRVQLRRELPPLWPLDPVVRTERSDASRAKARETLEMAGEWFTSKGQFECVRLLGYGGLGLTAQFKYTGVQPAMNLVLKVALGKSEDELLRREEMATRKMRRAAHCIQMIDHNKIGIPPREKFFFGDMDEEDSSGDSDDSSGDESVDDLDEPPRKRTRREITEQVPQALQMKMHVRRIHIQDRHALQEQREAAMGYVLANQHRGADWVSNQVSRLGHLQIPWQDYILLEFCEGGDLENLLIKINEMDQKVPNRVLWSFWLCLVRACVAMEYPPKKFHPKRRFPPPTEPGALAKAYADLGLTPQDAEQRYPGKVVGNDLYEDLPPATRRWAGKRMVHFDIDPKNILMKDVDILATDEEHRLVPHLKLADFGLAKFIKPNKRNAYYNRYRFRGKYGYYAPEQFGVDYDYVTAYDPDGPELSEQPVAGNFGSWTNVWGIALTLWQLMTGLDVPVPPTPSPPPPSLLDPDPPVDYCQLLETVGDDDHLAAHVDPELVAVLKRCLRHRPDQRPSLEELLQGAQAGIAKRFPGESDAEIRDWVRDVVRGAPTEPPPPPLSLSDADVGAALGVAIGRVGI
ncbi:protein kinase-like protein [Xylariomycetidae sp. FL2044]|nr:protein kinase-like protein [Xylariomycetidae sp. FL2044]